MTEPTGGTELTGDEDARAQRLAGPAAAGAAPGEPEAAAIPPSAGRRRGVSH